MLMTCGGGSEMHFYDILKHHLKRIPSGVVFHFDDIEWLDRYLDLGPKIYFGINGCMFKNKKDFSLIEKIPLEKMIFGTNSPWCNLYDWYEGHKFIKTKTKFVT